MHYVPCIQLCWICFPFILCATICSCLPSLYLLWALGRRQATVEVLPQNQLIHCHVTSSNKRGGKIEVMLKLTWKTIVHNGGIIAAGTDEERTISAEHVVCCICLGKYADNQEPRELPCAYFSHKECVDKWLKINAPCPLCKTEVGTAKALLSGTGAGTHHSTVEWAEF